MSLLGRFLAKDARSTQGSQRLIGMKKSNDSVGKLQVSYREATG